MVQQLTTALNWMNGSERWYYHVTVRTLEASRTCVTALFLTAPCNYSSQLHWHAAPRPMLTVPPLTVHLDLPVHCRATFKLPFRGPPAPLFLHTFGMDTPPAFKALLSCLRHSCPSCNTEPLDLVSLEYCPTASKSVCSPAACPCVLLRRLRPFPSLPLDPSSPICYIPPGTNTVVGAQWGLPPCPPGSARSVA